MITPLDVANTFLEKGKSENIEITPMKLQKLIYILYKEYLQNTQERLFAERFETWQYGPVVRSVYEAFRKYRSNHITDYYFLEGRNYRTIDMPKGSLIHRLFFEVWEVYKYLDGIALSNLTHGKNTAWSRAVDCKNPILKDSDIFEEATYIV